MCLRSSGDGAGLDTITGASRGVSCGALASRSISWDLGVRDGVGSSALLVSGVVRCVVRRVVRAVVRAVVGRSGLGRGRSTSLNFMAFVLVLTLVFTLVVVVVLRLAGVMRLGMVSG